MSIPRCIASICTIVGLTLATSAVIAHKKYDPGASDTEIKIGQTLPYPRALTRRQDQSAEQA